MVARLVLELGMVIAFPPVQERSRSVTVQCPGAIGAASQAYLTRPGERNRAVTTAELLAQGATMAKRTGSRVAVCTPKESTLIEAVAQNLLSKDEIA